MGGLNLKSSQSVGLKPNFKPLVPEDGKDGESQKAGDQQEKAIESNVTPGLED